MNATRVLFPKEVCDPVFPCPPNRGMEKKEPQPRALGFDSQLLHGALRCFCVSPLPGAELLEKA